MAYNAGKKILHRYMLGKKFLALEVWRKNILTENQITHTPLPPPPFLKGEIVDP